MRRRTAFVAPAILSLLVAGSAANAQARYDQEISPRFAVEGRVGASIPTEKLAGMDLQTGLGLEATARMRLIQRLSAYGGWDWNRFDVKEPTNGVRQVEGDGFSYGLRYDVPLMSSRSSFWVRGGGLASRIRSENDLGTTIDDTDYGAGWEAGAGFGLRLGTGWQLTPGVKYRELERDMTLSGQTQSGTLKYITAGVGLQYRF